MLQQLKQICDALGSASEEQVRQIVEAVNRRLDSLLHPQMIKAYSKEEAENGIILRPLAFINNGREADPKRLPLNPEKGDLQSWAYYNKCTVWIENLQHSDLNKPLKNKADIKDIPPSFLELSASVDSSIVIPFCIRDDVYGVYSLEFNISGQINDRAKDLIEDISRCLATMIWHADKYETSQRMANSAVTQFLNSIREFNFSKSIVSEQYKSSFIVRPFSEEFSEVEKAIAKILGNMKIKSCSYRPYQGRPYIVDDLMEAMENCHFCIADITGFNPNVMAEVGMAMIRRKPSFLMRNRQDKEKLPFNIQHLQVNEYELSQSNEGLRVWSAQENMFMDMKNILEDYISRLPAETGFSTADDWDG